MIKGKSAAVIFLALVMVLASAATAFGAQVIGEKRLYQSQRRMQVL